MRRPVFTSRLVHTTWDRASLMFQHDPSMWLPEVVDGLDPLAIRLPSPTAGAPAVEVDLTIGDPVEHGIGLSRGVQWHASRATPLFPTLDGQLLLRPSGGRWTRLDFDASYRPPLTVIGAAADSILGRKVATATIAWFVEQISARLAGERRAA